MAKRYWLFKSEPDVFSFQDLRNSPNQTTAWEGVRNYQARNLLRDEIRVGDEVFFYHSRQDPMHIAGICKVVKAAYPDPHQFDARSRYFDPSSRSDAPTWVLVDVKFHRDFKRPVTLKELKSTPGLENMMLLRKGARLSIQPVTESEWKIVTALGMSAPRAGDGIADSDGSRVGPAGIGGRRKSIGSAGTAASPRPTKKVNGKKDSEKKAAEVKAAEKAAEMKPAEKAAEMKPAEKAAEKKTADKVSKQATTKKARTAKAKAPASTQNRRRTR